MNCSCCGGPSRPFHALQLVELTDADRAVLTKFLVLLKAARCSAATNHRSCRGHVLAAIDLHPHALHPGVSCSLLNHSIANVLLSRETRLIVHMDCWIVLKSVLSLSRLPRFVARGFPWFYVATDRFGALL
jgi:hypothetical protein